MAGHNRSDDAPSSSLIRLTGEFVTKHREQLRQLARMADRAVTSEGRAGNILSMTDGENEIRITTDSSALAEKIGERVSAVCGGTVVASELENGFRTCLVWSRTDADGNQSKKD